jgi:archaellum component FlaC
LEFLVPGFKAAYDSLPSKTDPPKAILALSANDPIFSPNDLPYFRPPGSKDNPSHSPMHKWVPFFFNQDGIYFKRKSPFFGQTPIDIYKADARHVHSVNYRMENVRFKKDGRELDAQDSGRLIIESLKLEEPAPLPEEAQVPEQSEEEAMLAQGEAVRLEEPAPLQEDAQAPEQPEEGAMREQPEPLRPEEPAPFQEDVQAPEQHEQGAVPEQAEPLRFEEPAPFQEDAQAPEQPEERAVPEQAEPLRFEEPAPFQEDAQALEQAEEEAVREQPEPLRFEEPAPLQGEAQAPEQPEQGAVPEQAEPLRFEEPAPLQEEAQALEQAEPLRPEEPAPLQGEAQAPEQPEEYAVREHPEPLRPEEPAPFQEDAQAPEQPEQGAVPAQVEPLRFEEPALLQEDAQVPEQAEQGLVHEQAEALRPGEAEPLQEEAQALEQAEQGAVPEQVEPLRFEEPALLQEDAQAPEQAEQGLVHEQAEALRPGEAEPLQEGPLAPEQARQEPIRQQDEALRLAEEAPYQEKEREDSVARHLQEDAERDLKVGEELLKIEEEERQLEAIMRIQEGPDKGKVAREGLNQERDLLDFPGQQLKHLNFSSSQAPGSTMLGILEKFVKDNEDLMQKEKDLCRERLQNLSKQKKCRASHYEALLKGLENRVCVLEGKSHKYHQRQRSLTLRIEEQTNVINTLSAATNNLFLEIPRKFAKLKNALITQQTKLESELKKTQEEITEKKKEISQFSEEINNLTTKISSLGKLNDLYKKRTEYFEGFQRVIAGRLNLFIQGALQNTEHDYWSSFSDALQDAGITFSTSPTLESINEQTSGLIERLLSLDFTEAHGKLNDSLSLLMLDEDHPTLSADFSKLFNVHRVIQKSEKELKEQSPGNHICTQDFKTLKEKLDRRQLWKDESLIELERLMSKEAGKRTDMDLFRERIEFLMKPEIQQNPLDAAWLITSLPHVPDSLEKRRLDSLLEDLENTNKELEEARAAFNRQQEIQRGVEQEYATITEERDQTALNRKTLEDEFQKNLSPLDQAIRQKRKELENLTRTIQDLRELPDLIALFSPYMQGRIPASELAGELDHYHQEIQRVKDELFSPEGSLQPFSPEYSNQKETYLLRQPIRRQWSLEGSDLEG